MDGKYPEDFIHGKGVADIEIPATAPLQGIEIGSAPEGFPEISREGPDVCTLAARYPHYRPRKSGSAVSGDIYPRGCPVRGGRSRPCAAGRRILRTLGCILTACPERKEHRGIYAYPGAPDKACRTSASCGQSRMPSRRPRTSPRKEGQSGPAPL